MELFHQLIVPYSLTKSGNSELVDRSTYLHALSIEAIYKIFYGFSVAALYMVNLGNVLLAASLLAEVLQKYTPEIFKVINRSFWQPIKPYSC